MNAAVGYIEGEYVNVAPIEVAHIVTEYVRRGEKLKAGDRIATLETTDAEIAVQNADAALNEANAQLANILYGRRPEEIAAIAADLKAAQVQQDDALRTLNRRKDLNSRGFASQADLDSAQTAYDVASSRVRSLAANLAVAKLPARDDEILAAKAKAAQARAALDNAKWRLEQRQLVAPAAGYVSDIVRRVGDVAGPSAPVVSFLPDNAVKVKFYAPEMALSSLALGQELNVRCDGCEPGLKAAITYIAREPEFTPPVIYSLESRQTLVYLIEARAAADKPLRLQPGQIVDVELPGPRT
ncbi:MAG TPA: HlyD family efflux transporter periplasmic adaptor subunit [Roseiarcus sp.]|nr:HlyD family efflux transporter periplasmic adaptor subunit [Roseiarcus sp.]